MDLVKAFQSAGMAHGIPINIHGTPDEPMFQANQIGDLLGLTNIRVTLQDFDDDEKGVSQAYTPGGLQNVLTITEPALYRLLGLSRKPFAKPFQKWIAKVLKEIRLTGKYELERNLDLANQALEATRAESAQALEASKKDGITAARLARQKALLAFNGRHVQCVYIIIVLEISSGCYVIKIGETGDLSTRLMMLKSQYGMATLLEVFACADAHRFEQDLLHTPIIQPLRYKEPIKNCRGSELFTVDNEHTFEDFFLPLFRTKFEDHKNMVENRENRLLCLEELKARNEEKRLDQAQDRLELIRTAMNSGTLSSADLVALLQVGEIKPVPDEAPEEVVSDEPATDNAVVVSQSSQFAPVVTHRPTDKRVQQYDASLRLVAVHEGLREAARVVPGGGSGGLRVACINKSLYKGFRWHLVDRDDRSGEAVAIGPTVRQKHRAGRIAQLSLDKTIVVAVHNDQVTAATSVGLASSTSITNALRFERSAAKHLWVWYDDLDSEMRAAWEQSSPSLENGARNSSRPSHRIQQLDPSTEAVIKTFPTMSHACHELQASHKMLHLASNKKTVYKGYRWNVVAE
jgi:prophage antirepressor-like protein